MSTASEVQHISKAFLTSLNSGIVELYRDWVALRMPPISLQGRGYLELTHQPPSEYAAESRYFVDDQNLVNFVFFVDEYPAIDYTTTKVYVSGNFNGWEKALGNERWTMAVSVVDGRDALQLKVHRSSIMKSGRPRFKFVTEHHHWLPIDLEAPNVEHDGAGNWNYIYFEHQTGRHRFRFDLESEVDLALNNYVLYHVRKGTQKSYLMPGEFFFELQSDKELGAIPNGSSTVFRLFAPRARWVKIGVFKDLENQKDIRWILMERGDDFVWEADISQDLTGWYYWYKLDGPSSEFGMFDSNIPVLDPYAKATVSREGPGIVIDDTQYGDAPASYPVPQWQDLVVLESHVRDLVAKTKYVAEGDTIGFRQLSAFASSDNFYPKKLGVNTLELQPVQENDAETPEEYHWGYMTASFFAPASTYAKDPEKGSQVAEFKELVSKLHEQGMTVLLDVVYNHAGLPNHLLRIDKLYYYHLAVDGELTNWSGCGNDLRTDSRMCTRLIVDSLKHLVRFYGVDGFRFDLADLVGKNVLQVVERELKAIKPDLVLIAEPWSFRGHIGMELRDTGYASWNDGYREYIKGYVQNRENADGLLYFLKGSPDYYATWPAQTLNYVESHDDRVWIDKITENADFNGDRPTVRDIRRTHMMVAILMMSAGIPMVHSGMDFLRSKHGVNNTYLRGDINALDYERIGDFPSTADYFRQWIAFRQSELGGLLRHFSRVGDDFYEVLKSEHGNGLAVIFNASGNYAGHRLLFALNPGGGDLRIELGPWGDCAWERLADHERFWGEDSCDLYYPLEKFLKLPRFSCGLWLSRH